MTAEYEEPRGGTFRVGVNYWPARTAMGWWKAFERTEVGADYDRIAGAGFDSVRIFLTWEDFQPCPSRVDSTMIARLIATLDEAARANLAVMPTLFTGHMSGINWVPPWAVGGAAGDERFRVVSGGQVRGHHLTSWYDETILEAQATLARELAGALAGHPALWAWDLGNENSNCGSAPSKAQARNWLLRVTDAIHQADGDAVITIGLHMEDLEQDRNLGPEEAASVCNFLTMHGYPGYAPWTAGPTDERLLPFLTHVTQWLGGGTDVLFSEFGVPTLARDEAVSEDLASGPARVTEAAAAAYTAAGLGALRECGSTGAMLWCYSDYDSALWTEPPLDRAWHERSFGLWRADGSAKPAVAAVHAFLEERSPVTPSPIATELWLDVDAEQFYRAPAVELPRLYRRYCVAAGQVRTT